MDFFHKLLSFFLILYVSACKANQECNVEDGDNLIENVIAVNNFETTQEPVTAIFPAEIKDNDVRVISSDYGGGIAGSFWFTNKQRLGDGFVAEFVYIVKGSTQVGCNGNEITSDGFAFVAQNDKIENIQGGIGANLGFNAGLDKYIAVGFDLCRNRDDYNTVCDESSIIFAQRGGGINSETEVIIADQNIHARLKDCSKKTVRVTYLRNDGALKVYLKNANDGAWDLIADTTINTDLETLWENKFAHFGFTASSLSSFPSNVDISYFKVGQLISGSKISRGLFQEVEYGKTASFVLKLVDTCNNLANLTNLPQQNITATLTDEQNDNVLIGSVFDLNDGTYQIRFNLPQNRISTYTLSVETNGILAQNMPQTGALASIEPTAAGLDTQSLAIILSLIAVLILAVAYMIRRFNRYRQKLNKHKDDIDAGKVVHYMNEKEKNMTFSVNPLLGDIADMEKRLADNMQTIEKLKSKQNVDPELSLEELQEQNRKLREEYNKLKRKQQEMELEQSNQRANAPPRPKKNVRASFSQTQV